MRPVKGGSRTGRLGGVEQTQRKDLSGSRSMRVIGQVATWFDLVAQRPKIRKMYGMIFATGDHQPSATWQTGRIRAIGLAAPEPCSQATRQPRGRLPGTSRIVGLIAVVGACLTGQPAERLGGHLVPVADRALVDQGGPGARMAEPGHQFLVGRTSSSSEGNLRSFPMTTSTIA